MTNNNMSIIGICNKSAFFEYPVLREELNKVRKEVVRNSDIASTPFTQGLIDNKYQAKTFLSGVVHALATKIQQLWHSLFYTFSPSYKNSFNTAVKLIENAYTSKTDELTASIKEMSKTLISLNENKTRLEKEHETLSEPLNKKKSELDAAKQKSESLLAEKTSLATEIFELDNNNPSFYDKILILAKEAEFKITDFRLESAYKDISTLAAQVSELENNEQLKKTAGAIADTTNEIDNLSKQIDTFKAQLNDLGVVLETEAAPSTAEEAPKIDYAGLLQIVEEGTGSEKLKNLFKALFDNIDDVDSKIKNVKQEGNTVTVELDKTLRLWAQQTGLNNGVIFQVNKTVVLMLSANAIEFTHAPDTGLNCIAPLSGNLKKLEFQSNEDGEFLSLTASKTASAFGYSTEIPIPFSPSLPLHGVMYDWMSNCGEIPVETENCEQGMKHVSSAKLTRESIDFPITA